MNKRILIFATIIIIIVLLTFAGSSTKTLDFYEKGEELEELKNNDYTEELRRLINDQDKKYSAIKITNFITVGLALALIVKLLFIDFEIIDFSKKLFLVLLYFVGICFTIKSFDASSEASSFVYFYGKIKEPISQIIIPQIVSVIVITSSYVLHKIMNLKAQKKLEENYNKKTNDKWVKWWN